MSTSTARRIRRIGLLPQLSLHDVLDDNQRTKLKNLHNKKDNANERVLAAQATVTALKDKEGASEVEKTAAFNALADARSALYAANKSLTDLQRDLDRQLNGARHPRVAMTPEEVAAEAAKIAGEAKAARLARQGKPTKKAA